MNGLRVIAVIPARGGSKGVPRKNLAVVGGRPLIAWTVDAAFASPIVDRVLVSTDDDEIAEVALDLGAEVPFRRPADLAADDTPDLPVFRHLVDHLDGLADDDVLVHLRPTSPVRPPGLIDEAVRTLLSSGDADSVRSVSPVEKSPYKMWVTDDERLVPLVGSWEAELFNRPRQELPTVWQHDGVIDVVRVRTIREGSMSGRTIVPFFTPAGAAVDIDTDRDIEAADRRLRQVQPWGVES